ncbi:hypothetical protein AV530_001263 [Patagioenas fasciata monilis]|uniref:Uncharacterized protein n=1 Tax=Patagioenas fasciata monilis TaxID=372326 RepID=A0A1V4JQB7_PATFA|nr:hypothetical protein AV530_001263 [Patagioenas fasciata monilis]
MDNIVTQAADETPARSGGRGESGGQSNLLYVEFSDKMLSLKKYFTEGLIQFTILLSLIGVRVDVDTYLNSQLPPLREIILGQSSAYTQTQFHNLRNTLDGYGIHPKSVDLDYYFTARRLLNQDGSSPDSGVRESGAEQGFGEELEDLGAVAAPVNGDLTKEAGGER